MTGFGRKIKLFDLPPKYNHLMIETCVGCVGINIGEFVTPKILNGSKADLNM